MAGLSDLLSSIDSTKRTVKRRLSDLVENPVDYLAQVGNQLPETVRDYAADPMNFVGGGVVKGIPQFRQSLFKKPFDVKNGYASVLNNPIHTKDGYRWSGFTDAQGTTLHGYDKNGGRVTMRVDDLNPEDIEWSKDSNKTAEWLRMHLTGDTSME